MISFDKTDGSELHYIDYLANAKSVEYAGQGYGGLFCASILDRYHREDASIEEAYNVMQKCVMEIQKRLIVNLPNFKVAIVDKDGIRNLKDITSRSLDNYVPFVRPPVRSIRDKL